MDRVQMILSGLIEQLEHEGSREIVQAQLESYNQSMAELRKRADRDLMRLSARESAELAGGYPRVSQRGAPYGSRV